MSNIESMSQESRLFPPSDAMVHQANISGMAAYEAMCSEATSDYQGFWAKHARESLDWHKPFTKVLDESNAPFYKWFYDGELNASYNCLDRNLTNGNADKTAIVFEADDGAVTRITYRALTKRVCKFANAMKAKGITIDAVTLQNEPQHGGNNPSMVMSALEEANFVKNNFQYLINRFKGEQFMLRRVHINTSSNPDGNTITGFL